jgi:hypothetical protein
MFTCATSPITALFERLIMTRPNSSSGTGKTSNDPQPPAMSTPTKHRRTTSAPTPSKSPRNPENRFWIQEQQKRIFMQHLERWALNHDSCLHFQGKISLSMQGPDAAQFPELGKSVKCVLTDALFTDARHVVIVKLFPPQNNATFSKHEDEDTRRDSMEVFESNAKFHQVCAHTREGRNSTQQVKRGAKGHYKLVIRCGAGWMSSRDYFSKIYMTRLEVQKGTLVGRLEHDEHLLHRSKALGPASVDGDSVNIRPLFNAFQKLPAELQESILMFATGLANNHSLDLRSDDYGTLKLRRQARPPISLSTLFRVSKDMTMHMRPYIYHSTDFQFGLTGYVSRFSHLPALTNLMTRFTNFLWQSGPTNRREIRRLTFHFGKLALLHCIRWLAPDPVFSLLEPPVATNPRSLQYFWRCQIQDLVKDLNLLTLTINIQQITKSDIVMIIAIMKCAFGSIEKIRFVETDKTGATIAVDVDDERLGGLKRQHTWRQMCLNYYQAHRIHSYFFKFELLKGQVEDVENIMVKESEFFYAPFWPLGARNEFPASE